VKHRQQPADSAAEYEAWQPPGKQVDAAAEPPAAFGKGHAHAGGKLAMAQGVIIIGA
jgi:hypothetical protein